MRKKQLLPKAFCIFIALVMVFATTVFAASDTYLMLGNFSSKTDPVLGLINFIENGGAPGSATFSLDKTVRYKNDATLKWHYDLTKFGFSQMFYIPDIQDPAKYGDGIRFWCRADKDIIINVTLRVESKILKNNFGFIAVNNVKVSTVGKVFTIYWKDMQLENPAMYPDYPDLSQPSFWSIVWTYGGNTSIDPNKNIYASGDVWFDQIELISGSGKSNTDGVVDDPNSSSANTTTRSNPGTSGKTNSTAPLSGSKPTSNTGSKSTTDTTSLSGDATATTAPAPDGTTGSTEAFTQRADTSSTNGEQSSTGTVYNLIFILVALIFIILIGSVVAIIFIMKKLPNTENK